MMMMLQIQSTQQQKLVPQYHRIRENVSEISSEHPLETEEMPEYENTQHIVISVRRI